MGIKIGIQTKSFFPEMEPEEGIRRISQAGFEHIDLNLDAFLRNTDLYAGRMNDFFSNDIDTLAMYFSQYADAMVKYEIRGSQMHAPYPVRVQGRQEQNQYMQGVVIPKCIIIAQLLAIPYVVIHPFKMQYLYGRERERQENVAYFKMLIPLLKRCNVKVCFENLYESVGGRIVEGVCAEPNEALWYVDTMNAYAGEELFGFCLDTGHLQLVKRNPYEFITMLGTRLKVLHLHENDGITDLHQMPFTFGASAEEGLDWNGMVRGLKEINYQGTLSFETFPCMNGFPKTMKDTVLGTIYKIGQYLEEELEK